MGEGVHDYDDAVPGKVEPEATMIKVTDKALLWHGGFILAYLFASCVAGAVAGLTGFFIVFCVGSFIEGLWGLYLHLFRKQGRGPLH